MDQENKPASPKISILAAIKYLQTKKHDVKSTGMALVWPLNKHLVALLSTFFALSLLLNLAFILFPTTYIYSFTLDQALSRDGLASLTFHLARILSFVPLLLYATHKIILGTEISYFEGFRKKALWTTFISFVVSEFVFILMVITLEKIIPLQDVIYPSLVIAPMGLIYFMITLSLDAPIHLKREWEKYIWGMGHSFGYAFLVMLLWGSFFILENAPIFLPTQGGVKALDAMDILWSCLVKSGVVMLIAYVGLFCLGALSRIYAHISTLQNKRPGLNLDLMK